MSERSPSSAVPERPRRPRHLLDPNDLRRDHLRSQGTMESLTRVQMWVVSALTVTTILHLAAGAVFMAAFADTDELALRIGCNVIAGIIGVLAVAAGLLIHQRSPLSWWLLLGTLPGLVGAWVTFA